MKTLAKKLITAMMLGAATLGVATFPGPGAVAYTAEAHTYTWTVWAHSLRDGDYGHHSYSVTANSDQEALGWLSRYELAFGQSLQRQRRHYNSIESRFVSKR
jgi:hypothetical protein